MQAGASPARKARAHYRHEMRTLTYVTLDDGNGGIVRNLNHQGVAVQAVARLHVEQRVRMRFELLFPRLRVDAYGEVSWANASGQCGIRFVNLPAEIRRRIDEWIFSSLLASIPHDYMDDRANRGDPGGIIFDAPMEVASVSAPGMIGPVASRSLRLSSGVDGVVDQIYNHLQPFEEGDAHESAWSRWLRSPTVPHSLSPRATALLLDGLVMMTAFLLFAFIFLCIAEEVPQWRLSLTAALAAIVLVAGSYWALTFIFGGVSLGTRLVLSRSENETEAASKIEEWFR